MMSGEISHEQSFEEGSQTDQTPHVGKTSNLSFAGSSSRSKIAKGVFTQRAGKMTLDKDASKDLLSVMEADRSQRARSNPKGKY